jgi:GMP synthase PP-ATPase subunit
VKVCIDPFTEFVVLGSTVKEDVDDAADTILENRICTHAPGHESAEAFASSFRVENVGVAQVAADYGVLVAVPLLIRGDEWPLRIVLNTCKRFWGGV